MRTTKLTIALGFLMLQLVSCSGKPKPPVDNIQRSRDFMMAWAASHKDDKNMVVATEIKNSRSFEGYLSFLMNGNTSTATIPDSLKKYIDKDSLLTEADRTYMLKQLNDSLKKNWVEADLTGIRIASEQGIDSCEADTSFKKGKTAIYRKYGVYGIHHISKPVFSLDGRIALIDVEYYNCGGLCGDGRISVYIKIHGHWQLLEEIGLWVS